MAIRSVCHIFVPHLFCYAFLPFFAAREDIATPAGPMTSTGTEAHGQNQASKISDSSRTSIRPPSRLASKWQSCLVCRSSSASSMTLAVSVSWRGFGTAGMYTPSQSGNRIEIRPAVRIIPSFQNPKFYRRQHEVFVYLLRSSRMLAGGRIPISSRQSPTDARSEAARQMAQHEIGRAHV